jgi:hypothetical protein
MYRELLYRIAADVDHDGVFSDVLAGHEDDPGPSTLALRLAGALHWLVLGGAVPALNLYYPSVGGSWDADEAWPIVVECARTHVAALRDRLGQPPQTNEIGRSSALVGGLLQLERTLPIRLREIGASAGLNLRADHFTFSDDAGRTFGDPTALVRISGAWSGRPLDLSTRLDIVERIGCDVSPVDASTADGERTLLSYVWADQAERLARLRGAVSIARAVSAEVRPEDAMTFVDQLDLVNNTTTVLWHSVTWQYLSRDDRAAITERLAVVGASASGRRRFAHLFMEPWRRTPTDEHEFLVMLTTWPGGERRVLGTAAPHGVPVTWE